MYCRDQDLSKPVGCKSIFNDSAKEIAQSKILQTVFRFRCKLSVKVKLRDGSSLCFFVMQNKPPLVSSGLPGYDRVHACTKVQKPYVMSAIALTLEAGKPLAA